MKNSHRPRLRYRPLKAALPLLVLLGALTSTPAKFDPDPSGCDAGCIHWVKGIGCLDCQICCVDANGNFQCTHDYDLRDCGTGGPDGSD